MRQVEIDGDELHKKCLLCQKMFVETEQIGEIRRKRKS